MSEEDVKLRGMVPAHLKVRQSRILLDSLEVMTDIGFHEFEVGKPQRLLITVEIWLEDLDPPADDNHVQAWNYDYLRSEVDALPRSAATISRKRWFTRFFNGLRPIVECWP